MASTTEKALELLIKLAGRTLGRSLATGKMLKNMPHPLTIVKKSTKELAKPPAPPQSIAATNLKPKAPSVRAAKPPKPLVPSVKPGGEVNPGRNVIS